jgi:hypothetical protein
VMFNGVSTSGINGYRIQIGTTTPETSGYAGNSTVVANANVTATTPMAGAGFDTYSLAAAGLYHGQLTLIRMASNIWTFSAQLTSNETRLFSATGSKTTVGTIDILRITTIGSTDTFDAGSVNILYE